MTPEEIRTTVSQFADGMFVPHGRVELRRAGHVVYLEASGPFNTEAITALGAAWRGLFVNLPPGAMFADIAIMHHSVMASPDVLAAFHGFLQRNTTDGLAPKAVAWVVGPEVEGAEIMVPRFKKIYTEAGRNFRFFATLPDAEAWIDSELVRLGSS